ncbi:hypothetical protein VULLAG_LOCUS750 [Vulpes lagopus]
MPEVSRDKEGFVTEIIFCVHGSGIRCFCWELRNQDERPLVVQLDVGVVCGALFGYFNSISGRKRPEDEEVKVEEEEEVEEEILNLCSITSHKVRTALKGRA